MEHSTILEGKGAINYNKDSIPNPELQTPRHFKYEHHAAYGKFHTRPYINIVKCRRCTKNKYEVYTYMYTHRHTHPLQSQCGRTHSTKEAEGEGASV